MRITVVGSGLTGLFSAYYLKTHGHEVTVVESRSGAGGLIATLEHRLGTVETAANGIMNSRRFEDLCADIGCEILYSRRASRRRFVFRTRPRRWPLLFFETIKLFFKFIYSYLRPSRLAPLPGETVREWSSRLLGREVCDWLLAPALSGIYAGNPDGMSASLILDRFFGAREKKTQERKKPRVRGTAAPRGGMGELVLKLRIFLEKSGVRFEMEHKFMLEPEVGEPVVIATSVGAAAEILKKAFPVEASRLEGVEVLPLVTATLFFKTPLLRGFGCLFPPLENFNSLGVLLNSEIFDHRVKEEGVFSETWILGGALHRGAAKWEDGEILQKIEDDRRRLGGVGEPLDSQITRWPQALPHYTIQLEKLLNSGFVSEFEQRKIFLSGNYTGSLGLSGILEKAERLPQRIEQIMGTL